MGILTSQGLGSRIDRDTFRKIRVGSNVTPAISLERHLRTVLVHNDHDPISALLDFLGVTSLTKTLFAPTSPVGSPEPPTPQSDPLVEGGEALLTVLADDRLPMEEVNASPIGESSISESKTKEAIAARPLEPETTDRS